MTPGSARNLAAGGLLALVLTAYIPALRAGYIWDDDDYLTNNQTLRSLDGLRRIWCDPRANLQYYPLYYTSFWVEFQLWQLNPAGYHIVNVLLHGANAGLVCAILRRLELPGAWVAAAIFALHPVQVESVAWITERKNTLSALFYLLSLLAYLHYRPLGPTSPDGPAGRRGMYSLALLAFLAALLSKTATCSLPAAILLLTWWRHGRLSWRDAAPLVPFFALGLGLGLVSLALERHGLAQRLVGPEPVFTVVERVLIAGRAFWFYLGKLFWPVSLIHVYPHWRIDGRAWWQYLYPMAALTLLVVLWLARRRVGRGPLTAVLFFAGTLFPVLGFMTFGYTQYSFVADRFQYLPSLGIIALATGLAVAGSRRLPRSLRAAVPNLAGVLLVIYGAATWQRARVFTNSETLWRDTLAKAPGSWVANTNLGLHLVDVKRVEEALPYLETAVRIHGDRLVSRNALGNAYCDAGRYADAMRVHTETLRLHPSSAATHYNLGVVYSRRGQSQQAREYFQRALELDPQFTPARSALE